MQFAIAPFSHRVTRADLGIVRWWVGQSGGGCEATGDASVPSIPLEIACAYGPRQTFACWYAA